MQQQSVHRASLGSSWEESDNSSCQRHGPDIVDHGGETLQDVEREDDEDGQEEGVVVEDAEGGGLVLGNLVLLPQDPLVFFLSWDLLIASIKLKIIINFRPGLGALELNLILYCESTLLGLGKQFFVNYDLIRVVKFHHRIFQIRIWHRKVAFFSYVQTFGKNGLRSRRGVGVKKELFQLLKPFSGVTPPTPTHLCQCKTFFGTENIPSCSCPWWQRPPS